MKAEKQETWDPIKEAAEQQSFRFQFPPNESIPEVPSVRDWIVKRVIQGYPATFLLALSVVVAGAYRWDPSVLACAPLWALLLTFLFRPLVRNRSGGISYGGITLVWLITILLAPLLNLSSNIVLQQVQYGFLQSELPAIYLQGSLEQLFSNDCFCALLLLGGLVLTCQAFCEHRHFWLLERPEGRVRTYLPLLLPVIVLAVLTALISTAAKDLSPQQRVWLQEMATKLESRPFGNLPVDGDECFWRSQPKLIKGKENFQATLGEQDHKPTSAEELKAYAYYLRKSAELGGRPQQMLEDLHLQCRAIPYVTLDFDFGVLSKRLQKAPADRSVLQACSDKLKAIHKEIPTSGETIDLTAYRELHQKNYDGTFSTGSWSTYELKQHDRAHEAFGIRPLKLLNFSLSPSPVELFYDYQRKRLLQDWLELRSAGLPDKQIQRGRLFQVREDAYNDSTMGRSFWYNLAYQDQVDNFRASVEGLTVLVAIRQYQATTGSLPNSLDGLIDQPEKYVWQLKDGQGVLRGKVDAGSEVPASPIRFGGVE